MQAQFEYGKKYIRNYNFCAEYQPPPSRRQIVRANGCRWLGDFNN